MRKTTDSEKLYIWVILCVAICFVVWLFAMAIAYARPMSNDECKGIAQDMEAIAQMRDAKVTIETTKQFVDDNLRPHLGEPDSYIQYESDIEFMVGMVQIIYDSKMTAQAIAQSAYGVCRTHGYGVGYRLSFRKLA